MASLKSTVTLETTNLFAVPMKIVTTAQEQVNLNSDISIAIIAADSGETIYTSTVANPSSVVYMYIQSDSKNSSPIDVYVRDMNGIEALVMKFIPGDSAWFPLAAYGTGVQVRCNNLDRSKTAKVSFLFGERG